MPKTTEKYLSMAELATRLVLPESTMRYYCKRFNPYLSGLGEGRKKRYAPEAEPILKFIISSMQQHKNAMTVELLLREKLTSNGGAQDCTLNYVSGSNIVPQNISHMFPMAALDTTAPERFLSMMERQSEAMMQIAAALSTIVEHSLPKNLFSNADSVRVLPVTQGKRKSKKVAALIEEESAKEASFSTATKDMGKAQEPSESEFALKQEIQNLRQQLASSEKLHQQDLEQLRKWLARLGEVVANNK